MIAFELMRCTKSLQRETTTALRKVGYRGHALAKVSR